MPITMSTFCGTPTTAGHSSSLMGTAASLGIDDNGNLYWADVPPSGTPMIRKADPTGAITDHLDYRSLGQPFASVGQIAVNRSSGNVYYVADDASANPHKLYLNAAFVAGNNADSHVTAGSGGSAHLGYPVKYAVEPTTGDVYMESWPENNPSANGVKILKVAGTTMSVFAGASSIGNADGTGTAASFNPSSGMGMTFDDAGNLYIGNQEAYPGVHNIRRITSGGVTAHVCVLNTATVGVSGSFAITGLCWAPDGNLYVAGIITGSPLVMVLRVTPAGVVTTMWSDSTIFSLGGQISGIAADWSGNLYLAMNGGTKRYSIQKLSSVFTPVTPPSGLDLLSTLTDAFPSGSLNSAKWGVQSGSASVVSSGWLTAGSGDTLGVVQSVNEYRLDSGFVKVQVSAGGRASLILNARTGTDTAKLSIDNVSPGSVAPATILASWTLGGISGNSTAVDYAPTQHAWLRINRSDTAITFETSADGATWELFATPTPNTATGLVAGKAQLTGTRSAIFDSFNIGTSTSDPDPTLPEPIADPFDPTAPFSPPSQTTPGKGSNAGKTCAKLIELIRKFSSDVKRPIRIVNDTTIQMVNVNAPLPTGWAIADKNDLYHATTHELLAGETVLSTLTGSLTLNVKAETVRNDARIATSDWIMPEQLPMFGAGLGAGVVKSVTWTFTPDSFSASIEFKALPVPVNFRPS